MDQKLKVVYLSHYYPPEVNAPAVRVSEMSAHWVSSGVDVTVLTGFPNYPSGIIPPAYRGMKRAVEISRGLKVVRTWVFAAANKGFTGRVLNFLSFMASSVILGLSRIGRPDVIIATSPQFFVAVAGYVISRLKRCKFVFEIRDVWPEEIVAVGAITNRPIIKILELIEMFLYRKADLLVAVAQGTIDLLEARGVPIDKMVLIPNGVSVEHFSKVSDNDSPRKELKIEDKFVVGYIGTHGMAQSLETVLQAAEILKQQRDLHFLLVGDGAEKANLVKQARELGLTNITFHDQVSRKRVADFYKACDICLVPLRKAELFTKNIPSKIYEIMASRRPILISTNGESRKLVESSGAGIGSQPEDAADMAEKINLLYHDQGLRRKMGEDGYTFAISNCSRTRLAEKFMAILLDLCDKSDRQVLPASEISLPSRQSVARTRDDAEAVLHE